MKNAAASKKSILGKSGRIALVGSGPGDVDLLTIAAHRAITTADVILADTLTPPSILALVNPSTQILHIASKVKGCADKAQESFDNHGISYLNRGLYVIRLKNGDPFLFGRGGEELVTYRNAGYEPSVIPGISSALASPVQLKIPATLRRVSNQILIITGHGKADSFVSLPTFVPNRTVVILMGMSRLGWIVKTLVENEFPKHTPVAIVQNATRDCEKQLVGTLDNITDLVKTSGVTNPATIIIGNVLTALDTYSVKYEEQQQQQQHLAKKKTAAVPLSYYYHHNNLIILLLLGIILIS